MQKYAHLFQEYNKTFQMYCKTGKNLIENVNCNCKFALSENNNVLKAKI